MSIEKRDKAFMAAGGQRLAQVIVYLEAPTAGGETKFFSPPFPCNLSVKAEVGKALVFPVATLVERYGTVSFPDFSPKPSNFRGLVLGCIGTDFCN